MSAPYATEAPFSWDFELDRKSITETATGDVIVSGYASTWDEDRMLEAFEPGAFSAGWRRFLATNPQVLWMHDYEVPLGVVEEGRIDQKGLWVRCRLDAPAPGSRAEDIVRRVVRGSVKAFSVGGRWVRHMTPKGMRIHTADVMEVSIASVPVNPFSLITSVAQKSFQTGYDDRTHLAEVKAQLADLKHAVQTHVISGEASQLQRAIAERTGQPTPFEVVRPAKTGDPLLDLLAAQKPKKIDNTDNLKAAMAR